MKGTVAIRWTALTQAALLLAALLLFTPVAHAERVVFHDSFDYRTMEVWNTVSAEFAVRNAEGNYALYSGVKAEGRATVGRAAWADYAVEADLMAPDWNSALPDAAFFLYLRYQDYRNFYALAYYPGQNSELRIIKNQSNTLRILAAQSIEPPDTGVFNRIKAQVKGNEITGYLGGEERLRALDEEQPVAAGQTGIYYKNQALAVDNVTVTAYGNEESVTIKYDEVFIPQNLTPDHGWYPMNTLFKLEEGSAADLRYLNADHTPAGKHGFVKINENGDYYFGDDPEKITRFYGPNVGFTWPKTPTREQVDMYVELLCNMGYNLARYSCIDYTAEWAQGVWKKPTSTTMETIPERFEFLDYYFYKLKERGLYVSLDIISYISFASVPGVGEYGLPASSLAAFFPPAMDMCKQMLRDFATHVNPYTGIAYKDDPMFVNISPYNEHVLWCMDINKAPAMKAWYLKDFNQFLARKGKPPVESIPGLIWDASYPLIGDITEYLSGKSIAAFDEMYRYLKEELGVKAPIGGINMLQDSLTMYYRTFTDAHETHVYNGILSGGSANRITYNHAYHTPYSKTFTSTLRKNYALAPTGHLYGGYMPNIALSQLYNKPFLLTEGNQESPSAQREEYGFFSALTAAYNGWDMFNRFEFGLNMNDAGKEYPLALSTFSIMADSVQYAQEYQSNLIMKRSNILPADVKFVIVRDIGFTLTNTSIFNDGPEQNMAYLPHLYKLANVYTYKRGIPMAVYKVTPDLTPEQIAAGDFPLKNRVNFTRDMSLEEVAEAFINALDDEALKAKQLAGLRANTLISDTGEMVLDLNTLVYSAHTPYFAGAAGEIGGKTLELGGVTLRPHSPTGSVSIHALDEAPLAQSSRMLLIYITQTAATGQRIATVGPATVHYYRGSLPNLVKKETASVTLRVEDPTAGYAVYKLDLNGKRLARIPVSAREDSISFEIETDKSFFFEVEAARQNVK